MCLQSWKCLKMSGMRESLESIMCCYFVGAGEGSDTVCCFA